MKVDVQKRWPGRGEYLAARARGKIKGARPALQIIYSGLARDPDSELRPLQRENPVRRDSAARRSSRRGILQCSVLPSSVCRKRVRPMPSSAARIDRVPGFAGGHLSQNNSNKNTTTKKRNKRTKQNPKKKNKDQKKAKKEKNNKHKKYAKTKYKEIKRKRKQKKKKE